METLTLLTLVFDTLLGLGLLWLAWLLLNSQELFKAIVLFVAFGLLMALAWVRLDAPDVALAEAAIGAGLTGALLLAALAKLQSIESTQDSNQQLKQDREKFRAFQYLLSLMLLLITAGLGYVVISMPPIAAGLSNEVAANMANSGVSHPVTAVLLNFRGYDTLLELFVLLLALLGVWSFGSTTIQHETNAGPVLLTLTHYLVPVLILVAAYLLWVGAHAPGGAFQAGSVLAAAGVLLLLSGWRPSGCLSKFPLRLILVAGPGLFAITAALLYAFQGELLNYPTEYAGIIILAIEATATLSIGVTLAALFLGSPPHNDEEHT